MNRLKIIGQHPFNNKNYKLAAFSPPAQFRTLSSFKWSKVGNNKPCPLCDEAKEVLEPYKKRFILQEVDITLPENSGWYDKYKYDIPVFHFNGKFLMKHRVDIQKFEDRLRKLELQSEGSQ
uniref:Glutaredoxin-like protein n=1 Tax=Cyanistes caeruleus TaxID=156563 RepID=A0A8C0V740_CYACU